MSRESDLAHIVLTGSYPDTDEALSKLVVSVDREETVPIFLDHFRRNRESNMAMNRVSHALGALNTGSAFEPLLEILRAVRKSTFAEDGSMAGYRDDGAPAFALVEVPGALQRLKSACSSEEFEWVLLRAFNSHPNIIKNPDLCRQFGEIGSQKTIGRLVFTLLQTHWPAEDRKPAIEALVKAGKKAHRGLLEILERTYVDPSDPQFQTKVRNQVLEILKESGDDHCLPVIGAVMRSDPSVTMNARAAMDSISRRCSPEH